MSELNHALLISKRSKAIWYATAYDAHSRWVVVQTARLIVGQSGDRPQLLADTDFEHLRFETDDYRLVQL